MRDLTISALRDVGDSADRMLQKRIDRLGRLRTKNMLGVLCNWFRFALYRLTDDESLLLPSARANPRFRGCIDRLYAIMDAAQDEELSRYESDGDAKKAASPVV